MPINFIPNQNVFILAFPYQKETMEPTFQVANDWFTEAFSKKKKKKNCGNLSYEATKDLVYFDALSAPRKWLPIIKLPL